jgi:hypothetical protein
LKEYLFLVREDKMGYQETRLEIKDRLGYDIDIFYPKMDGSMPVSRDDIKKYPPKSLLQGIRVEMEHTSNVGMALEIALAHLNERSDYYVLLKKHVEKD